MKSSANCILAFLGGAIAGAAVALLMAPKSGEETRRMIKDFARKEFDDLKCHCHDKAEEVKKEF